METFICLAAGFLGGCSLIGALSKREPHISWGLSFGVSMAYVFYKVFL